MAATGAFTVTTVGGGSTPAVPSGLTATAISSSQIDLSWTAAANATGYNIYRANAAYVATSLANKITAAPITGTTYNDTGLTAGTTYYYRVATVNAALQSMPTPDASATTMANSTPATPVGTQMGGSRQGIAVSLTVGTAPVPYNFISYYSGATAFAGSSTTSTDGIGLLASFNNPRFITTDGINLYVAESASIRKIDIASGAVVTFATTYSNTRGITTDGTNLFVAAPGWGIQQINIATGVVSDIPLIQYSPANPTGVNLNCGYYGMTVVGSNLYCISGANTGDGIQIVDISNTATRGTVSNLDITDTTAMIGSTVFVDGLGKKMLRALVDLTTDGTNLYLTRGGNGSANPAIDKIVISTGVVSTIAGGGAAGVVDNNVGTSASFTRPYGITTDGTSLFVTDRVTGGGIRKINIQTTAVTGAMWALETRPILEAQIYQPLTALGH